MLALTVAACVTVTPAPDLTGRWWFAYESSAPELADERVALWEDGTLGATYEGSSLEAKWNIDGDVVSIYAPWKVGEAEVSPLDGGWHLDFSGIMFDGEWVRVR